MALAGDASFTLTTTGAPSLANINYFAVDLDTNGMGFTFWIDGLTFLPAPFLDCSPYGPQIFAAQARISVAARA